MTLPFSLDSFHFLRPAWLLALLVLPLLGWWWRRQMQRHNVWRDVVDPHLLPHLLEQAGGAHSRSWSGWLAAIAAALCILALAGPSVRKDETPLWQTQAPLVIALDLSASIVTDDLQPSRLAQARAKVATLLRERAGGQVALVAFSDDAYTVAPLTEDTANIALFLDALAPDIMPSFGVPSTTPRADRAISWSQGLMRQAGFERGDILLLTDRADGAANTAAAKANTAGYRVSVLGLGTARGGAHPGIGGNLQQARLDATSLRKLASSGGGHYATLVAGKDDLQALGVLDSQDSAGMSARGEKATSWRDDGYWLLPLVMLLCLPLFRRGGIFVVLLAGSLLLPVAPASAQSAPPAGTWWKRADQVAHQRMQAGVAAYRSKDYARAIEQFSGIDSADGHYNLGNALAKAGRYDDAIAAYDRALQQQPGMTDAILNKKAVELARKLPKRQDQQGQQDKQGPPQQPGDSDKQDADPGKGGSQKQPPRDGQGQPPSSPKPPQPEAGEQTQSQQAQQQADAAQRQRMQDAMRQQQGDTQPAQAEARQAKAKETAEQRERRLANQAWLQRVPDDPGALLRARFRLEAERRQGGGE